VSGRRARFPSASWRYDLARQLLDYAGFDITPAMRPPSGFLPLGSRTEGEWRLRGHAPAAGRAYIEVSEELDTRRSYPEPWGGYEYLVHFDRGARPGRSVSFHKDRTKPPALLYHWHDYPDGARRSTPVAMGPVTLRWFLDAVWTLIAEPELPVPALLARWPPPGPGDPH
jgi:hypothetical protein